jgi:hypothetical protein
MNINDIPSELLLHIFSYLPQRDLINTTDQVCQYWRQLCLSPPLWRNVEYLSIYGNFYCTFEHLFQLQSYVRKLKIPSGNLIGFFKDHRKLQFLNLKTLDLSDMPVRNSEAVFGKIIERCPNLENIKFYSDRRPYNMEHSLSKLSDLELLTIDMGYFCGTQTLDENLILFLKRQPRLKKLVLRGWHAISNTTISDILDYFPNILSFYIDNNDNISNEAFTRSDKILNLKELTFQSKSIDDDGLQHVTKRAKQLKVLNIEYCEKMTDKALHCISQYYPLLEKLSFGKTSSFTGDNFTNRGLFSIAERLLSLKYLSVIGCKNIDDDGVISLVKSCHGLTYIRLKGCTEMTDNSLLAIGEHCHLLREADFSNCFSISARGVYCLIRSCTGLYKLNLSFCRGISNDNIDDVKENHLSEVKDQQTETENQQTETENQQTEINDSQFISKFAIHSHLKELVLRSCTDISKETVLRFTGICPDLSKISLFECIINSEDDDFILRVFDDCQFLQYFIVHKRTVRKNYIRKS